VSLHGIVLALLYIAAPSVSSSLTTTGCGDLGW